MHPKGVLISYDHPSNEDSIRGSGILFNSGLVLTNGAILVPLIHVPNQKKRLKNFSKTLTSKVEKNNHLHSNIKFRIYEEIHNSKESKLVPLGKEISVAGAWKCPLVSRSLNLFQDWTLGDVTRGKETDAETNIDLDMAKELMSIFILLDTNRKGGGAVNLSELLLSLSEPLRGQDVLVESTPFGSELFLNSLSRGIVSNVVGSQKCLILTDARTVVGCEGGPIFANDHLSLETQEKGKLLGMVGCSLTWWRGEWLGLTIGISLAPVLRRLIRSPIPQTVGHPQPNVDNALSNNTAQSVIDETVVLIRCGCTWGSGVVLDARSGIIITCSHVIRNESTDKVSIFFKGNSYPASVIYRTRDNLAFDLAVIKTEKNSIFTEQIEFAEEEAKSGEAVIAAGFPLLSEREDPSLRPTLVHGCVARTCPFMLQTTCCVQSGASGGAVLRDGKLLGVVVCNARDSNTGALFPHVNFAVPVGAFQSNVLKYIETGKLSFLEELESKDAKVQRLWRLQTSKL